MIQDLLSSPTDGHKAISGLVSSGIPSGEVLNTSGIVSIASRGASAGCVCGWNDPYISYPADPCAEVVFPSVAVTAVVTSSGTEWYLTLTFTSCDPACNTWEFSYAQSGPPPENSGGATITCSHTPYTYNIRIYPSYSRSPHFIYSYTITNCCGTSQFGTATVD